MSPTLELLVLVFWVLLALDRKRWWPGEQTLPPSTAPLPTVSPSESVLVVVPARNEAATLPQTLPSLLSQTQGFVQLVVVDDGSTDGTAAIVQREAAIVQREAAAGGQAEKVTVLSAPPRLPGWSPKVHALNSGLSYGASSGAKRPSWLLFTDADIRHSEESVARLLAKAKDGNYDMVSIMVRLKTDSFWEKLLIPPFVYFFHLLYPFRRVAEPHSKVAAAAGGCILVRRESFERAGGFDRMRGAIIDDVSLARGIKADGGRLWLGLDSEMVSVRGYGSLTEIVQMVARTAFTQLRYRYSLALFSVAFLALFFVAPPVLLGIGLWRHTPAAAAFAAIAWTLQAATLRGAVRHHGVPPLFTMTLPLATALYAYMTGYSAWRYFRTGQTRWKGRALQQE